MKHRVKIEVPLSGVNDEGEIQPDTFTIQPPCFYCGKPIASDDNGYFDLHGNYKIKFWGVIQDSHKPKLGDVIDIHGNFVKGKFTIRIPYCPEHIKPVRTFTLIDSLAVITGTLLGISLVAFFGGNFLSDAPLILAFILLPLLLAGLFYGIGTGIKSILPRLSPKLRDYASHKGHYGICSHGVRVEGGRKMEGPITYWLQLAFCSAEGARRFLGNNPGAEVISGKRFIGESI